MKKRIQFLVLVFMGSFICWLPSITLAVDFNKPTVHFIDFDNTHWAWRKPDHPGLGYPNGTTCFMGDPEVLALPNQVVYRLQATFDTKFRAYKMKISAFHVVGKTVIKDPLNTGDFPEFKKSYLENCTGEVVESAFTGHEASLSFTRVVNDGSVPATFDVVLGESEADLKALNEIYSPLFKDMKARSNHLTFYFSFNSNEYGNVDRNDPVAFMAKAIALAKKAKPDTVSGISIVEAYD